MTFSMPSNRQKIVTMNHRIPLAESAIVFIAVSLASESTTYLKTSCLDLSLSYPLSIALFLILYIVDIVIPVASAAF